MAKRGRPAGSKNRPKLSVVESSTPSVGHNQLSDDDQRALHFRHVSEYKKALEAKKKADADFKNVTKRIKAEGGAVDDVKLSIELESPQGEAKLKERFAAMQRIAAWNNLPIGTQGNIFDVDRRPTEEKAFDEGKRDGMQGKTLVIPSIYPPDGAAGQKYAEGWHAGQAAIMNIRPLNPKAEILRPDTPTAGGDKALDDALAGDDDMPWPDDVAAQSSNDEEDFPDIPESLNRMARPASAEDL